MLDLKRENRVDTEAFFRCWQKYYEYIFSLSLYNMWHSFQFSVLRRCCLWVICRQKICFSLDLELKLLGLPKLPLKLSNSCSFIISITMSQGRIKRKSKNVCEKRMEKTFKYLDHFYRHVLIVKTNSINNQDSRTSLLAINNNSSNCNVLFWLGSLNDIYSR